MIVLRLATTLWKIDADLMIEDIFTGRAFHFLENKSSIPVNVIIGTDVKINPIAF